MDLNSVLLLAAVSGYGDVVDGYPPNNGVHPNGVGYAQIGATIYSWMKAHLPVR